VEAVMSQLDRDTQINISAVPVSGVGGLGLVAMAVLITIVTPELWGVMAIAAAGGVALGLILIVDSRHTIMAGRTRHIPTLRV
jgi:hypothetical protein